MLHLVPFYNKIFISERFGQFQLYQDLATGLYKLCIQKLYQNVDCHLWYENFIIQGDK